MQYLNRTIKLDNLIAELTFDPDEYVHKQFTHVQITALKAIVAGELQMSSIQVMLWPSDSYLH